MITNKYTPNDIVFGRTETEIEKTITRALNKIGVPVDYSKISSIDEEGISIGIQFKELSEANPIERKVTQGQVEFWLGTNPLKMAIETLTSVANGDWKPTLLNQDVLDTCNDCDYEEASDD